MDEPESKGYSIAAKITIGYNYFRRKLYWSSLQTATAWVLGGC